MRLSKMKLFVPIVVLVTLSLGCAAGQETRAYSDVTPSQASQNRARPFMDGKAALGRFAETNDCNGSNAVLVESKINELEQNVSDFHNVRMNQYEVEAREYHIDLAFSYADECVEKGCLKNADRVYRRLMEFYVGASYSGIRDRARVGIDDVREAQSVISQTP